MDATLTLIVKPRDAVPSDPPERVLWLERFGVLPESASVQITAPLGVWTAAGAEIAPDGTLALAEAYSTGHWLPTAGDHLRAHLHLHILGIVRSTGIVPERLDATVVSGAAQVREIQRRTKEREEAEERRKAAELREPAIVAILAAPASSWLDIVAGDGLGPATYHPANPARRTVDNDPRIVARKTEIVLRLPALRAARQAEKEAQAAAEKVKLDAYHAALRLVASQEDDLLRAVREGYSVERAVLDRLAQRLAEAVPVGDIVVPEVSIWDAHRRVDRCRWKSPGEQAAPSREAFRLWDNVQAAVRRAHETLPPAIGRWEVSRIVRVDTCPHEGEQHFVTAVLATLETITSIREVTFSTEPQACGHEDDA